MIAATAATGGDPDFYWDDIIVNQTQRSSLYQVSESEIIDFASRYDPMPIHIDRNYAAANVFGAITASGSHMLAIRQRLVLEFAFTGGVIASIGYDEVRFLNPLRADQQCQVEIQFIDKRPTSKRVDRGVVIVGMLLLADDKPVLTLRDIALMRRRVIA